MNLDFASILERPGFINDWARKVQYNIELSADEKEMNAAADAFWKEVAATGDQNKELAALLRRSITLDTVEPAGELLSRLFNEGSVGEFDDVSYEVQPKNTLQAHDAVVGGNVDASYIDHKLLSPTWKPLQIETYVSLQDLRKGGYRNVANLVNFAREAFELKRVSLVLADLSAAITNGNPNYIAEATAAPTDTSMGALSLYLNDVSDGSAPIAFALSKYVQAVGNLTATNTNKTDVEKGLWNSTGFVKEYAGIELMPYSGQKKLADGTTIIPDKTVFGAAGKIGNIDMRGELVVLEDTDINKEKLHLKLNNFVFGWAFTDLSKAAKIVIAQ